jgi:SAM-dependent methyltransferase
VNATKCDAAPPLPAENIFGHTKKLRFLLDRIAEISRVRGDRARILDFGCGNGEAVSQFLIGPNVEYVGIEQYPPCLDHARARFAGPDAVFFSEMPADVDFDAIVYADVLEHLHDPVAVLRAHRARLRDGGMILGSIPNGFGPYELEARLDRRFSVSPRIYAAADFARQVLFRRPRHHVTSDVPYNHGSSHVQFFTRSALRKTLHDAGYRMDVFAHGCFAGASVSGYFVRGARALSANIRLADLLPHWAVSTWYFSATKI